MRATEFKVYTKFKGTDGWNGLRLEQSKERDDRLHLFADELGVELDRFRAKDLRDALNRFLEDQE